MGLGLGFEPSMVLDVLEVRALGTEQLATHLVRVRVGVRVSLTLTKLTLTLTLTLTLPRERKMGMPLSHVPISLIASKSVASAALTW